MPAGFCAWPGRVNEGKSAFACEVVSHALQGTEGSSWHPAGTFAAVLVLRAGVGQGQDTAPDTAVWSVVTAPRLSHNCNAVSLPWCGSSGTAPVASDREKLGEKLIPKILVAHVVAWESKVCHCGCCLQRALLIKAKQAVKFHGPLPVSQRRLSVMRAKLPFNVI